MRASGAIRFIIVAFIVCVSCSHNNNNATVVRIDTSNTFEYPLDTKDGFLLEPEFLGAVSDVIVLDSTLIISSNNKLLGFSIYSGHSLCCFSREGRGPEEYLKIWDFGADHNNLYLYDIDGKKILFFRENGEYLESVALPEESSSNPFQSLIPARWNNGYVGKRIYGMPNVPELSFYDSLFRYVEPIGADELRSGIRLWRQFFNGADNDILYNRYFSNDINAISADGVRVKYSVDFGKNNLPRFTDEYEAIDLLSQESSAPKYASIMSQIVETKSSLCFQFVYNAQKYYVLYDKVSQEAKIIHPTVQDGEIEQILYHNNSLIVIAADAIGAIYLYNISL